MKVDVLVKSIAKGGKGLEPRRYDYPPHITNGEELIRETVKICLRQFREKLGGAGKEEDIPLRERAASGKVVYGLYSNRKPPEEGEAAEQALEAFADGTVAVFVDGKEIECLTEEIGLAEGSEVVFVKLAALSASCILLDWMD